MGLTGDGFDVRSLAATYPDGFRLDAHAHPWGQLIYARSGLMRVTVGATVWFVPPTCAVWAPPGAPHEIAMRGAVSLRTLYISPERARGLAREAGTLEVTPLLRELILHILGLGMLHAALPDQHRLAGVLVDLVAAARRQDLALPLPVDARALALAEWLLEQPDDRSEFSALAAQSGASLRTLQRLFSAQTGLTLELWRRKVRLVHAAAALAGGAPVTEAALAGGYDSLSAFIQAFARMFGVTPGRYRRQAA